MVHGSGKIKSVDARALSKPARQSSPFYWLLLCLVGGMDVSRLGAAGNSTPTFTRDIAPILFRDCLPCHRSGEAGPFPLLSYADASKHAHDLAEVTASRQMPPWLPEQGPEVFRDARRLTDADIARLRVWADAGAPEGRPEDLPALPQFTPGWQLGPPDLVVTLSEAYELGPDGADVYRNFVVPLQQVGGRFVQAFEFRPQSPAIHHARLLLDSSGEARKRLSGESAPGFPGTMPPGHNPPGHLLVWAPGRLPSRDEDGLSWKLDPGTDLIVQLHLRRTGRRERVQPQIGFYFTAKPPTQSPFLVGMLAQVIDIPPDATDYTVQRSFVLPADVELLGVMPHAHYLGREVWFTTTPPGGTPQTRLHIPRWDFNWQGEYRYAKPISLAAGTRLDFRLAFDNSTNNLHNPSRPPRQVRHGPQTTDEMAEFWLQLIPCDAAGLAALQRAYREFGSLENVARFSDDLRRDPNNAVAHLELAKALGALGRKEEAFEHLKRSADLEPGRAETHHYVGVFFLERGQLAAARDAFERALGIDANYYRSQLGLGLVELGEGRLEEAENRFRAVLRLNPGNADAQRKLTELAARRLGK